ncbi:MAG: DUF6703 family protein [Candidatus Nanopelagicales bacterium]
MEFSRKWLETVSAPLLTKLHLMPRWIFPLFTTTILLLGLFLPGLLGALFLAFLVLMLSWLLVLSWPVIGSGSRLIRVAAVGVLILATWIQISS